MKKISAIIPVFNSRQGLRKTLEALINQEDIQNEEYEVLVVDNNSTDYTLEVAKNYCAKYSDIVKVYIENIQGSYAARNKGIKHSQGDVLCFIDADMEPEIRYLAKILDRFNDQKIHYAGVRVDMKENKSGMISDYDSVLGFRIKHNIDDGNFVPTCCLSVSKHLIKHIGNFDSRLESGGDLEFGKRAFDAGYSQVYFNDISVIHPSRDKYRNLSNKFRRIARGYAQLYFYYPDRFGDIPEKLRSIKFYLPNHPLSMYHDSKKRNLGFNFFYCFLLSFILVPLRIEQVFEYFAERKKLY